MLKFSCHGDSSLPTILFLHGAGISSWMWHDVVRSLSGLQIILVDLPGHGDSRCIPWTSLADTAKKVHAIMLLHQNGHAVHISGVSLGAYVGLELMRQQPKYYTTAMFSGMHAKKISYQYLMKLTVLTFSRLMMSSFFARRTAKSLGCRNENIDKFVNQALKTNVSSFSQASIDVINFVLPQLSGIYSNVLFVAGDKEHYLVKESLTILADSLPNGKYQLIPSAGHGWPGVFPKKFAEMLMQQINDIDY